MSVGNYTKCDLIHSISFIQKDAESIYQEKSASLGSYGGLSDLVPLGDPGCLGGTSYSNRHIERLYCDPGFVLTGIELQTRDANWPNKGKRLTLVKIKCHELMKGRILERH